MSLLAPVSLQASVSLQAPVSLPAALVPSAGQIRQPVRESSKDTPARIGQAATDFEALLLGQMLKTAREALEGDDEEKDPNSAMIEFGEQQFAQALASSGGFGIAKMVVAGLRKNAD
jgi:Rod binding domain-containing protein